MADELSGAVELLRTSTHHLNSLCDEAAELIRDVETFLDESRVGMYASVCIGLGSSPEAEEPEWEDWLSYCRVDSGKFRIAIERNYHDGQASGESIIRAWSECTREDKLHSLEKLPLLLVELAKQVTVRTASAGKVLSSVRALIQLPKKRKGG